MIQERHPLEEDSVPMSVPTEMALCKELPVMI